MAGALIRAGSAQLNYLTPKMFEAGGGRDFIDAYFSSPEIRRELRTLKQLNRFIAVLAFL